MKTALALTLLLTSLTVAPALRESAPSVVGDYLEVRTCDVYTGPCFANAEMGLVGKECIMVWSVRQGQWNNQSLDGLKVIAVVRTAHTLGDLAMHPREGKALLIVDARATSPQREALVAMARHLAGPLLIKEVVDVQTAPIDATIGACTHSGCASVKAGRVVEINTRCLGADDHLCGNEETFYPPLTEVAGATPAFTEVARFAGEGLNQTWQAAEQRSAFIATFAH